MKCLFRTALFVFLSAQTGIYGLAQQPTDTSVPTDPSQTQDSAPAAVPSAPVHPITLEQEREMFDLMHFGSTMQSMLHVNLDRQRKRAPFIPEDVWQDFEKSFSDVDFVQLFLPVYQKYLSQEDAAKALEFYRTPAGQHTLAVMPALMRDVARTSQDKGEEISREVFERHHEEIEDAAKKYSQSTTTPENPSESEDHPK